jgi:hypothetical protein
MKGSETIMPTVSEAFYSVSKTSQTVDPFPVDDGWDDLWLEPFE